VLFIIIFGTLSFRMIFGGADARGGGVVNVLHATDSSPARACELY